MMPAVDALFVGNAIMDVFGSCDDTFLTTHEIEKGSMTLVDEARAQGIAIAASPLPRLSAAIASASFFLFFSSSASSARAR